MDSSEPVTITQLLDDGDVGAALLLVEKEYQERITTPNSPYLQDILALSAYYLRNGNAKAAYSLLTTFPAECVELAVNLVAAAQQIKVPEETLYLAQLQVLHSAYKNPALAEQVLRSLFAYSYNKKKWETVANCGAILFPRTSQSYSFCITYAESCIETRRLSEAIKLYRWIIEELADEQQKAVCYARLAGCYKDSGKMDKCLEAQRKCVDISQSTSMQSNLMMMMQYTHGYGMEEYYQEGERLRDLCGIRVAERYHPPTRYKKAASDGLRVGFISGDFCEHSLTNLLLPIFQQFKAVTTHETYAYYTKDTHTNSTKLYADSVDHFLTCPDMTDTELAKRISDDGIDILIDLSGNTAHNRLPLFYLTPAPMQVGWVSGMMTPPAVDTIPYFITDAGFVPKVPLREKLLLLPSCYTYEPLANSPSVKAELPYESNGYITFGSFNNPCKINDSVLRTWLKILQQVPDSRLLCKTGNHIGSQMLEKFMAEGGIAPSRVQCIATPFPRTEDLMSTYTSSVDIALDTWPCAGMLTSLEAMWMGCPVPTLGGNTFLHNQTVSVLTQLELPELIASTEEGYVQLVVGMTKNLDELKALRNDLRERIKSAPLYDAPAIAKSLFQGLDKLWDDDRHRMIG
jgi:protein O-GlcNAc transferase